MPPEVNVDRISVPLRVLPPSSARANTSACAKGVPGPGVAPTPVHRKPNAIRYCLARASNAGLVLAHCVQMIWGAIQGAEQLEQLIVFKIGICVSPEHRWGNSSFGYKRHDQMDSMLVLHRGSADQAAMLEAALILHFRTVNPQGLQNERPGGEGISPQAGDVYVYLVYRHLPKRPPPL